MELTTNLMLLLTGITILVWGANKFVDHASVIAKHLGVGDLVIGLTLIAAGTSAPEVFVGISAVLNGNEDIALGTALGSNISNIASKINDDKILCQKILNEVGFAMLPGSDFGLEADKFLTRIAFVDFDGLAALKIIKDDDFSSNNLLDIICPRIVKGVSLLKEWVQNQ